MDTMDAIDNRAGLAKSTELCVCVGSGAQLVRNRHEVAGDSYTKS
jgi:hypothetical protein